MLESDVADLETIGTKIQIAFDRSFDRDDFSEYDVVTFSKQGSVAQMIVKGNREEILCKLRKLNPVILEILPMTLEEAFTYKLESQGVNTLRESKDGGLKGEK